MNNFLVPLLEVKNISKSFRNVSALINVDFRVEENEIVGLVGDNGAGKSTLIKILSGVIKPDKGEVYWKGVLQKKYSFSKAKRNGITTVFQDRALVEQHSIWRNVFIGREITNFLGIVNVKKEKEESLILMQEKMKFTSKFVSPDNIVGNMSGGEKQGVAISRALYFNSNLIILDEPAAGLSLLETTKVLNFIRDIKNSGKSCIFITHNLFHVYPVAERIVIIDRGEMVDSYEKNKISLEELENVIRSFASGNNVKSDNQEELLQL